MRRVNKEISRETVVVLPHRHNKILMQLRDFKPGIIFPGSWSFFGGSIERGESPLETAKRELYEETEYVPEKLYFLSTDSITKPYKIKIHAFHCRLKVGLKGIRLHEGFDTGLFSFKEIFSKWLFSGRAKKACPLIDDPYMEYIVRKLKDRILWA